MGEQSVDYQKATGTCPHGNFSHCDKCRLESKDIEARFSPVGYLDSYYRPIDAEKMALAMKELRKEVGNVLDIRELQKAFPELNEQEMENLSILWFHEEVALELMRRHPEDGLRVLDIGGGPTIYQHIPLVLEAGSITHTEFLESNRTEVERWVDDETTGHDWSSYFAFNQQSFRDNPAYLKILADMRASGRPDLLERVEKLEYILSSPEAYEQSLKDRMTNIIHGDVFIPGLGLPGEQLFDVVTEGSQRGIPQLISATFAFEGATAMRDKWEEGFRNTLSLVKPGGYLSVASVRNAECYAIGETETLPAASVNEEDFRCILADENFQIVQERVVIGLEKETVGYDGMVFVFAKRREDPPKSDYF